MNPINNKITLKSFLDEKVDFYNRKEFILSDPISIPHLFDKKNDVEIAAFLTATIAWGKRAMIIASTKNMMNLMNNAPYEFIKTAKSTELARLNAFVYRTFQPADLLYFVHALKDIFSRYESLENCFKYHYEKSQNIKTMLSDFHDDFFSLNNPGRTSKHVSNTKTGAAAKRLNMFLRWMVRKDNRGVDFGLWNFIPQESLLLPLDVHTARVGRKLGLLERKSNDWKAVEEITNQLRLFDPTDPVKYDFALFGLGVFEQF